MGRGLAFLEWEVCHDLDPNDEEMSPIPLQIKILQSDSERMSADTSRMAIYIENSCIIPNMDEKMVIRYATEADAALLANLGARTFKDSFGSLNRPEDIEDYITTNFSLAKIGEELRDPASIFFIQYDDGKAIGYAKLSTHKNSTREKGITPIELVRIYVDQPAIGKGYGSALMQACLEEAKRTGYDTIWLGVWEKNDQAIRFYERWGFRVVGNRKFVLGEDVQNDLVMERPIRNSSALDSE